MISILLSYLLKTHYFLFTEEEACTLARQST